MPPSDTIAVIEACTACVAHGRRGAACARTACSTGAWLSSSTMAVSRAGRSIPRRAWLSSSIRAISCLAWRQAGLHTEPRTRVRCTARPAGCATARMPMDAGASIGRHSPWQRFIGCEQAKVLGLGIAMGPVTFYHALEDAMGDAFPIPVWEHNTALLACLDHHGKRWEVTVRPLDPLLAQRRIDQPGRGHLRDYFQDEFDAACLHPWTRKRCGIVVHPGADIFGSFAPAGGRACDDL